MTVSTDKLLAYWDATDKKERCGLVLKKNRVIEVINVHPDPTVGFEIDPAAILRHKDEMIGTWHTHPTQTNTLSNADYICFMNWPNLEHFIMGTNGVKRYIIKDGLVVNED